MTNPSQDRSNSSPRSSPNSSRLALLALDRGGIQGTLRYLLQSYAIFLPRCVTSVWIHGENPAQFDAAHNLIREVMRDRPHVRLVLTSTSPITVEYLRASFPDDQACPAPWNFGPAVRRFYSRVSPRALLLLDGGGSLGGETLDWMLGHRIPIRVVNLRGAEDLTAQILQAVQSGSADVLLCVRSQECADQFRALGVRAEAQFVTGSLDLEPGRPALNANPESVRKLLGVDLKAPIVIAAGILPREERQVLEAFAGLKRDWPDARLVLEPLHRVRTSAILKQIRLQGWVGSLRSRQTREIEWDIMLADLPGELAALFTTACIAILGTERSNAAAAMMAGCPVVLLEERPGGLGTAIREILLSGARAPAPAELLDREATCRTMDVVRPALPSSRPIPRFQEAARAPTLRDKIGRGGAWKAVAPFFMKRRMDTWPALRERVRHPKSVLCLGNGPSSEDPRLQEYAHDCLIRVNWRWKTRGFLTRPDLVFVGDAATVHKLPPCIFGIWSIRLEYALLLRHAATHGMKRMEYIAMERLSPIIRDRQWPARPSNGALMVVAGAGLNPDRLIIGGMDLFLHPDGRYAGDMRSHNEYAHAHARETDLEIIHLALAGYRGEVVILSDILRESLGLFSDRYRSGALSGL